MRYKADLTALGAIHVLRVDRRNPTNAPLTCRDGVALVRRGLGRLQDADGHLHAYRGPGSFVHAEDLIIGTSPTLTFMAVTTEVELVVLSTQTFTEHLEANPALRDHVLEQLLRDRDRQRRFDLSRRFATSLVGTDPSCRWRGVVASYLLEGVDGLLTTDVDLPGNRAPYDHLRGFPAPTDSFAVPISRIAGDLDVSPPPIRDALQRLENDEIISRNAGMLAIRRLSNLIDAAQSPAGEIPGLTA